MRGTSQASLDRRGGLGLAETFAASPHLQATLWATLLGWAWAVTRGSA